MAFFVEVATLQSHHATFVIVFHASSLVPVWANLHPLFLQDQAELLGPTQRLYWLASQSRQATLKLGFRPLTLRPLTSSYFYLHPFL